MLTVYQRCFKMKLVKGREKESDNNILQVADSKCKLQATLGNCKKDYGF